MKASDNTTLMEFVGINQAAKLIGVSDATIRNWIKTGILIERSTFSGKISLQEVISLNNKIERGEINRLKQRANKSTSSKTIIPNEYISPHSLRVIQSIIDICNEARFTLNDSLFYIATAYLINRGEILQPDCKVGIPKDLVFRRKGVERVFLSWSKKRDADDQYPIIETMSLFFKELEGPIQQDLLGAIYQILSSVGIKSEKGSYYTPTSIVSDMISGYNRTGMKFLDPCCGTGQFLLCCAKQKGCHFDDLYGIDIDPIASYIASINLLLAYPNDDFTPNIYNLDTLTDIDFDSVFNEYGWMQKRFDIIATNPPWGAALNKKELSQIYHTVKSGESYSYFIAKCYDLLKNDGILSLILPESILNIKVHKDIREFILKHFTIISITELGRAFSNVFTKVCRLDMVRAEAENDHDLVIINQDSSHYQRQKLYSNLIDFSFITLHKDGGNELLDKFFSHEYITLRDNADWALGIVTGDNHKFLSDELKDGYEPIYRGKDVMPMRLNHPQKYIYFAPELFQQIAPEWKYRVAEKLIYRFISRSLVFAYDNNKVLTLNSANICIPRIIGINMPTLAALFNSKTYNYLFTVLFNTHKVLRTNLEELPIPVEFLDSNSEINRLSDSFTDDCGSISIIDEYLMDYFLLSNKEKDVVRNKKQ